MTSSTFYLIGKFIWTQKKDLLLSIYFLHTSLNEPFLKNAIFDDWVMECYYFFEKISTTSIKFTRVSICSPNLGEPNFLQNNFFHFSTILIAGSYNGYRWINAPWSYYSYLDFLNFQPRAYIWNDFSILSINLKLNSDRFLNSSRLKCRDKEPFLKVLRSSRMYLHNVLEALFFLGMR